MTETIVYRYVIRYENQVLGPWDTFAEADAARPHNEWLVIVRRYVTTLPRKQCDCVRTTGPNPGCRRCGGSGRDTN